MWISLQCVASIVGILCIYAPTTAAERSWFWDEIVGIVPSVDSWIVGGDFNNVETFDNWRAAQPPALPHIARCERRDAWDRFLFALAGMDAWHTATLAQSSQSATAVTAENGHAGLLIDKVWGSLGLIEIFIVLKMKQAQLVSLVDYFNRVLSQWTRIDDNSTDTQQPDLCLKDTNEQHGMRFSCIGVGNYILLESSCDVGLDPILFKCFRPSIGKSVFQCGMKTFYFLRDHDFTYMVVADTSLGPLVAFGFLDALKEDFEVNITNLKSFWPRYIDLQAFIKDHMHQIMNYVERLPAQDYLMSIDMVDTYELQDRLRSASVAFDHRIKLLEAAAQQFKDELGQKMIFITGSKDLLSFRDIVASSLMKSMEERLCKILWQVLQSRSFQKYEEQLERHQIAVHKLRRGKFGFQFMELCKIAQRYDKSDDLWHLLRETRDMFVRERYGDAVSIDMRDLTNAMVGYFRLRNDRNAQEHLFESTYPGDIPVQRLFLTELSEALSGDVDHERLKGMEPLLRLEVSSRLEKLS
ncbi:hypothetical protein L7F22_034604 [Adiantum nelumboides]|nr:hypothetical protein [Adiantum nelumboides]